MNSTGNLLLTFDDYPPATKMYSVSMKYILIHNGAFIAQKS
jgi:hypothetical protein